MTKKNKGLTKKHALRASKFLQEAVNYHQAGDLQKAESIYQAILNNYPGYPEAHFNLGVVFQSRNEMEKAIEHFKQAIDFKPVFIEAHINLGNALQILGRLDEAILQYKKVINIKPGDVTAYISLGYCLLTINRAEEAITFFEKAVAIKPKNVEVYVYLGNAYLTLGRAEEAISQYEKVVAIRPNFADIYVNLGNVLQSIGRFEEARTHYEKSIVLKPDYAEAHHNLGLLLNTLGNGNDAIISHRRAISLKPKEDVFWSGMALTMETLTFDAYNEDVSDDIIGLLDWPTIDPYRLIKPIISFLHCHAEFKQILKEISTHEQQSDKINYKEIAKRLSAIPLLLKFMSLSIIPDIQIEKALTILRRSMIFQTDFETGSNSDNTSPFSIALAMHCFTNDYIFRETTEERNAVEQISNEVSGLLNRGSKLSTGILTALASYRPLYEYSWAKDLLEITLPAGFDSMITRLVKEPLEEISLCEQIPVLTKINNKVSLAVQQQYEQNPYPRWIKGDFPTTSKSIKDILEGPLLGFDLGDYVSPTNPQILVPGCGTGHQALYVASRYSDATILAIDISLRSISYAMRKTHEHGFRNINYAQGDIIELGNLKQRFDIIDCSGVLHHLEEPLQGWNVLLDLLQPGGLMKIALYSEIARKNITRGRTLIAEKGYGTSQEDIRDCRQEIIKDIEEGNREIKEICEMIDFYNLSECRDLLFHIQEHCFTLPQIEVALQDLGLNFLGFELRNQKAMSKFKETYSAKSALTSLSLWHEFETQNPNTFLGMYQFWVRKSSSVV